MEKEVKSKKTTKNTNTKGVKKSTTNTTKKTSTNVVKNIKTNNTKTVKTNNKKAIKNTKDSKRNDVAYIIYIVVIVLLVFLVDLVYRNNNQKETPNKPIITNCNYDETAPSPESVYLKIDCNGTDLSGMYKKGDYFTCGLSETDYEITINDIEISKIKFKSSSYGLFPVREDGTISLLDKVDEFVLNRCSELDLALQATDSNENIIIKWE